MLLYAPGAFGTPPKFRCATVFVPEKFRFSTVPLPTVTVAYWFRLAFWRLTAPVLIIKSPWNVLLPERISVPVPVLLMPLGKAPLSMPDISAVAAPTCTSRIEPDRLMALRKVSLESAVLELSTSADGTKLAEPIVNAAGLASVPNATCTSPPRALKPLAPEMIRIMPADAPAGRAKSAGGSKTPPCNVSRLLVGSPTASPARNAPPLTLVPPV